MRPTIKTSLLALGACFLTECNPAPQVPLAMPLAQVDASPVFYVVEGVDSKLNGLIDSGHLVRVSCDSQDKLLKELVVATSGSFFGHFSDAKFVDGKFAVARYGGVVDLRNKKVIHDENHEKLLGVDGRKVIYRVDNARRPQGVFAFDLRTKKLEKLDKPGHWNLPGVKSLSKTQSLSSEFGKIELHRLDGTSKTSSWNGPHGPNAASLRGA